MGVRNLSGTPWHTEKVHRADGDDRRYKGRCIYYAEKNSCKIRCGRCIGSAHCSEYKAMSDEEFKKKSKKNTEDDDCYWY